MIVDLSVSGHRGVGVLTVTRGMVAVPVSELRPHLPAGGRSGRWGGEGRGGRWCSDKCIGSQVVRLCTIPETVEASLCGLHGVQMRQYNGRITTNQFHGR